MSRGVVDATINTADIALTLHTGPTYWDQGIFTVTGLKDHALIAKLPVKDLPLNECFMLFSAVGLLFNIAASTKNVYASLPPAKRTPLSLIKPLSRSAPYVLHTTAMVLWLYAFPRELLHTTLLIPFMCFWGVAFAHHVQLLILSHLTASPFPAWWKHPLLVVSMLGSADANAHRFFGANSAVLQTTPERLKWTIFALLGFGLVVYGHFVVTVINDICDFYQMK